VSDPLLKRLELAVRRGLIAGVNRFARRPRQRGLLELPDAPRILLLRHDRLGDAIVSTASMKLLRERFPDARIEILLGRRNRAVAPLLPAVDEALELSPGIAGLRAARGMLRARRYDVVVNLLAKDSSSGAILAVLSGARWRVGFAGALADIYDFPVPRPSVPMHIVPETSLLLAPFGIAPIGAVPSRESELLDLLPPSASIDMPQGRTSGQPRILFSISAPTAARSWPDERVVALVDRMRERELHWSIVGVPADRERVERIARESGAESLPATGSYPEFIARLATADIVVTPQTSTVHAAAALRRPTVLLNTSSASDTQWTPWGVPHRVVSAGERLDLISVDAVVAAVDSLVAELRARDT
jgi:ADP-heptose:LPS heptosyltransferase